MRLRGEFSFDSCLQCTDLGQRIVVLLGVHKADNSPEEVGPRAQNDGAWNSIHVENLDDPLVFIKAQSDRNKVFIDVLNDGGV